MTEAQRRTILQRLANGELSADEADQQLTVLDGPIDDRDTIEQPIRPPGQAPGPTSQPDEPPPEDPTPRPAVRARLSGGGHIEVLGEDGVDEAYVDGPASATVTRTGGVTEVRGDMGEDGALIVPAEADLDVRLDCAEGSVLGVRGTVQALFNVGEAHVEAQLTRGDSRIDANCGELEIDLMTGSDVIVSQRCASQIVAGAGFDKTGRGQWTLGAGTARLEVTGNLGEISLSCEDR